MAKIKVTVTHEETGDVDFGDIPPRALADLLRTGDFNLADDVVNGDWKITKIQIGDEEYPGQ